MKVTVGKAKLPEKELKDLSINEVKRRAAKAEGRPAPPLTEVEVAQNDARAELARRRNQPAVRYVPFEFEGFSCLIKDLPQTELNLVALAVSRDGFNVLNINDNDGINAVQIAVFEQCVTDEDKQPLFKREDLLNPLFDNDVPMEEWTQETQPGLFQISAEKHLVAALFKMCEEINGGILGTVKND